MKGGAALGPAPRLSLRKAPLLATVAVHAGVIALFFLAPPAPLRPMLLTRALSVFDIAASAAAGAESKASQPKRAEPLPTRVAVTLVSSPSMPDDAAVSVPGQGDTGVVTGACDLTEPVRAALQGNQEVLNSLPTIPRDKLSVANAIMIWKAAWLDEDRQLDATAVAMIRDVVAETIAAATPECRMQPQIGPRLLLLSGTADTVVLAVGSGEWRWQDLLDTANARWSTEGPSSGVQSGMLIAGVDHASMTLR